MKTFSIWLSSFIEIISTEAALHALQSCSKEKVFWNYAANLQENSKDEVCFQ